MYDQCFLDMLQQRDLITVAWLYSVDSSSTIADRLGDALSYILVIASQCLYKRRLNNYGGKRYRTMINELLLAKVDGLGLVNIPFSQDGVTAHTAHDKMHILRSTFPDGFI